MTTSTQRFHTPVPHPSDITGRRAAQLSVQKAEHEEARARLQRDLAEGHGFVYLTVPGYGEAVIAKDVYEFLKKELAR